MSIPNFNPLVTREPLPDFAKIQLGHYLPAIDYTLAQVKEKLEKIKVDTRPPDFENVCVPLESLFEDVSAVQRLLGNATGNTYTQELADIEEKVNIKVAAVYKNVFQDPALGARFRTVYDACRHLTDADDKALLKSQHESFEDSGAFLAPEGQKRIREIDEKLISLAQKFKANLQEAPKKLAVLVTDAAELAGLSKEEMEGFAESALQQGHKTGWLITPERLLVDELLERAENRVFREKIHRVMIALGTVTPHDNRPLIAEMMVLRHEYAALLGYDSYAAFARARSMMTGVPAVYKFLHDVTEKALPKFEADMRTLQAFAAKNGGPSPLEPWDVSYWVARQRDALYHFDANGFSKYLEVDGVMQGLFAEAGHLFGLSFKENKAYSVMHPDIRTYDVAEAKAGKAIGILHVDMFARPGTKGGGAWMSQLQAPTEDHPNVIIFNMNIAKPPKGSPALVGLSQYITIYHEMGHALQGLLGTNVKYRSQQGTAAPSDFVEIHSMINERRGTLKNNLKTHARHVETGKPAPDDLIDALIGSKAHFEARDMLRLVQNSLRDLAFHTIDPKKYKDGVALENSVALDSAYAEHVRPYPLARFGHLFSGAHSGYAAGYVNYLIAQSHAADGFAPFESDPYNAAWSKKLGDFYRRGSGGDPAALYREYRGRDATPDAMLREAGIVAEAVGKQAVGG